MCFTLSSSFNFIRCEIQCADITWKRISTFVLTNTQTNTHCNELENTQSRLLEADKKRYQILGHKKHEKIEKKSQKN